MSILDEVIERLPYSHRYEGYISALCIFHQDSTPSLLIYPDRYRCLACGAHGKTSRLLATLEGRVIKPAKDALMPTLWRYANAEGMDMEDIAMEGHRRLLKNMDNAFYLKNRGITPTVIKTLKIGFLDGWFTFPVMGEHKEVMGLVARAGSVAQAQYNMRYLVPPHQPSMLYVPNWTLFRESPYIIVTFGIIDAITLSMINLPSASGTAGHNLPVEIFKDIRKRIYFIPDGDGADDKVVTKLITQLGWRGSRIKLDYPDDTKDCNDIYCKTGAAKLKELIKIK